MQFLQLSNNSKFPVKKDFYYELFAFDYCSLNPFDRKTVSTGIVIKDLTDSKKYIRVEGVRELFDNFGILCINDIIEKDCEIRVSLFNTSFPTEYLTKGDVFTGLFGMKNKYTIKPGDLIARMFVVDK